MKLLVRYCQWAHFSTKIVEVHDADTMASLEIKICEKFLIDNKEKFLLKFLRDGFNVRLCSNFPLAFYEFEEKSIILLELIENSEEIKKISERKINNNYFEKLGLLKLTKESEQDESEDLSNLSLQSNKSEVFETEQNCFPNKKITFLRNFPLPNLQHVEQPKSKLDCLLKSSKLGQISEAMNLLKDESIEIVDTLGKCGWNAFHYSIFHRHYELAINFINKGVNLNTKTFDEWTPLQLSVYQNQQIIFNKILSSNKVDLDLMTSRGTALHLACKLNKLSYVEALIMAGSQINLKTSSGYLAVDLTANEQIAALFQRKSDEELKKIKVDQFKSQIDFKNISLENNCPEKPPIIKGEIFKIGETGITVNKRFFILNAEEGTLIRFKKKEDWPLKPLQIIPLKDIELIRKIEKPWYISKPYNFFEIKYSGKRQTLACKYKSTMKLWIKYLYQAAIFSLHLDTFLAKINEENLDENHSTFMNSCFILSKSSALELFDNHKDEDLIAKQNFVGFQEENQVKNEQIPSISARSTTDVIELEEKTNFKSFQIIKLLGSGAFGKVYLARKKNTNAMYALKVLKKRQLINKKQVRYANSELNILKKMNNPFILNLYFSFQTPQNVYMALDYCPGKDLALHIVNYGVFSQEVAKFYIAELILAIEYLHSLDIIYRDLKPENILLDEQGHIKLADFGLSKEGVKNNNYTMSFCGSPVYLCPEMLRNKGYSKMSDIYGIGLVLYEMITGNPPFYSDEIQIMFRYIMNGKVDFPKDINKETKSLIENLLQKTPEKRFTIAEIKEHEFFRGLDWEGVFKKKYQPPKTDHESSNPLKIDKHLNFVDWDYTEENYNVGRFPNFSFAYEKI